jgi:epoxyqueuosine reductase QueG
VDLAENSRRIKKIFDRELAATNHDGIIGVAEFRRVYDELMPVQRSKLADICGDQLPDLVRNGSVICIGIAYPERAIDCIDTRLENGGVDKDAWNIYAREYRRLNRFLDEISGDIANLYGGMPIPATVEGIVVKNVEDYYATTVSHRLIAENAGLGWRGKNELIVNQRFSCALRFASVITSLPLIHGDKVKTSCGNCRACLDVCSFLKNKDKLKDYRESCRKYIADLGLEAEVCGKCVKACYRRWSGIRRIGRPYIRTIEK